MADGGLGRRSASRGALLARVTGGQSAACRWPLACGLAGLAYGAVLNFSTWATYTGDHSLGAYLAIAGTALPVRHRPRRRQRRLRAGLRPGAAARARALPRALRGHLAARGRRSRPRSPSSLALAALLRRGGRRRRTGRAPTWSRPRTPTAAGARRPARAPRSCYTGWAALGLAAAGRNPPTSTAAAAAPSTTCARAPASSTTPARSSARSSCSRPPGPTPATLRAAATSSPSCERRQPRATARSPAASSSRRSASSRSRRRAAPATRGRARRRCAGSRASRTPTAASASSAARRAEQRRRHGVGDPGARAAGGRRSPEPCARAVAFLRRAQNPDGGFPLAQDGPSNAQSTAFAVQALRRRGREPGQGAPRRLALAAGLPALADHAQRRRALLAHQRPDAGLGHRPGGDGPGAQVAAARRWPATRGAGGGGAGAKAGAGGAAKGEDADVRAGSCAARRARSCGWRTTSARRRAAHVASVLGFPPRYESRCPEGDRGGRAPRRARARGRAQADPDKSHEVIVEAGAGAGRDDPRRPVRGGRRHARRSASGAPTSSSRSRRPAPRRSAKLSSDGVLIGFLAPLTAPDTVAALAQSGRHRVRDGGRPAHLARPVDGRAVVAEQRRRLPRRPDRRAAARAASSRC